MSNKIKFPYSIIYYSFNTVEMETTMRTLLQIPTKFMIAAFTLAFVAGAYKGHYISRAHIDEGPAEPGLFKKKYYH